jgi:ABC-type amino acid transport substrate-binding protein
MLVVHSILSLAQQKNMLTQFNYAKKIIGLNFFGLLFLAMSAMNTLAKDVYKIAANQQNLGYWQALLTAGLDNTKQEFGPYEIVIYEHALGNERHKQEIIKGDLINARVGLTTVERETNFHPIRIPVRKGLLNNRLLLTNQSELKKFEGIETLEQLKQLKVGLVDRWITSDIFHHHDFDTTRIIEYAGLFRALKAKRYDYTVRGVNEIYTELDNNQTMGSNFAIVPNLGLVIQAPSYFFISKQHPRLAKRLETGLENMIKSGEFDRIFLKWHQTSIDRANLQDRKLIEIGNPFLPAYIPTERPELWFRPNLN